MSKFLLNRRNIDVPPIIGGVLVGLAVVLAGIGVVIKPAMIVAGMLVGIVFLLFPASLLWGFFFYQWTMYLPHIGDKVEAYKLSVGSVNVTPNDLFFAMFALLIGLGMLTRPIAFRRALNNTLGKLVAVFSLYQLGQMLWCAFTGVPIDTVVREGVKYLVCIYMFYIFLYFDRARLAKFARFAYILVLVLPLFQVYMLASGAVWYTSSGTERTFFIGANILYMLVIIYHLVGFRFNAMNMLVIAYMIAGMVMTQYRSAFVALLLVLFYALVILLRRGAVSRVVLGSIGMLMLTTVSITVVSFVKPDYLGQVVTRYSDTFNTEDLNVSRREIMWKISFETFLKNPVLGVGVARPIDIVAAVQEDNEGMQWSPHNFVMRLLAKEGAIGAGLALLIRGVLFRGGVSKRLRNAVGDADKHRFLLTMIMLFVIDLMNATFTYFRTSFVFWMLAGVYLIGLATAAEQQRKPNATSDVGG
ncbi:O-antigen ligase family protein [Thiorhodovibrio frisius]|uniref:Lipid A core-O-antigen ligase-like enyme n=1 Tax=Thiorhodovibrio frisius TaxID=631362 RepID=H8YYD1_9GAMM|nr:O-antigen ligase family protein [Thiorhodovibrio frisius]EIC23457.1 lipid A core-O-antigen ligase-like enyme [Thiorhodovibrio frisius]WPL23460.1 Lipid A core - O-antigen ligase [Thiorhodovibrio frisius]